MKQEKKVIAVHLASKVPKENLDDIFQNLMKSSPETLEFKEILVSTGIIFLSVTKIFQNLLFLFLFILVIIIKD